MALPLDPERGVARRRDETMFRRFERHNAPTTKELIKIAESKRFTGAARSLLAIVGCVDLTTSLERRTTASAVSGGHWRSLAAFGGLWRSLAIFCSRIDSQTLSGALALSGAVWSDREEFEARQSSCFRVA